LISGACTTPSSSSQPPVVTATLPTVDIDTPTQLASTPLPTAETTVTAPNVTVTEELTPTTIPTVMPTAIQTDTIIAQTATVEAVRQTTSAEAATQTAEVAKVSVPNVTGTDSGSAESTLSASGLVANTTFGGTGCNPYMVVSQDPAAGTQLSRGASVTIQVCPGVVVPNVVGMDKDAASATLSNAGLVPSLVSHCDGNEPDGQVWSTNPGGGSSVGPGTVVTVHYFTGCGTGPSRPDDGGVPDF
jgi:hypothetical protein